MLRSDVYAAPRGVMREIRAMYKEFAAEAVVWVVPIVVLIGLALLVTS
ncbi:hypothetical protein [Nonomuraea sp. 3-1Str]|nr:hypothetical protein [Nonomuraea sp. 3-1Str]MDR8414943.1 hypothetical protein [Nonomuraea sp. 3-1Str]